jgi:hypothetical protein
MGHGWGFYFVVLVLLHKVPKRRILGIRSEKWSMICTYSTKRFTKYKLFRPSFTLNRKSPVIKLPELGVRFLLTHATVR